MALHDKPDGGTPRFTSGSTTTTYSGSTTSGSTTVAHGLGVVPKCIVITPLDQVANGNVVLLAAGFDATSFAFRCIDSTGTSRSGSVTCYWMAVA